MKTSLLAVLALGVLPTVAFAADLPSRQVAPVFAPPPIPTFTWTGAYLGITAGYAFDTDHGFVNAGNNTATTTALATGARPGYLLNRSSGFTGGGEIGYNYEFANSSYFGGTGGVVVGIEADAAYVGPGDTSTYASGGLVSQFHSRTDYLGTVRGRLGYAFDKFLVYGTGGFAYGGVNDNVALYGPAGVNTFGGVRDTTRTGYAYGGGIAYAIPTSSFLNVFNAGSVTLKAEFLHYDLGTSSILVPSFATTSAYTSRIKTQGDLVRAGIDYKFDFFSPPAPVVARY